MNSKEISAPMASCLETNQNNVESVTEPVPSSDSNQVSSTIPMGNNKPESVHDPEAEQSRQSSSSCYSSPSGNLFNPSSPSSRPQEMQPQNIVPPLSPNPSDEIGSPGPVSSSAGNSSFMVIWVVFILFCNYLFFVFSSTSLLNTVRCNNKVSSSLMESHLIRCSSRCCPCSKFNKVDNPCLCLLS